MANTILKLTITDISHSKMDGSYCQEEFAILEWEKK